MRPAQRLAACYRRPVDVTRHGRTASVSWCLVALLSFACSEPFESQGGTAGAGGSGATAGGGAGGVAGDSGSTAGSAGVGGVGPGGAAGSGGTAGAEVRPCEGAGRIVYDIRTSSPTPTSTLWGICPNSSDPPKRLIASSSGVDTSPSWHPTRDRVVFARNQPGTGQLLELNPNSSLSTTILETTAKVDLPLFSPSGDRLAYVGTAPGKVSKLMLLTQFDGAGVPARLTDSPEEDIEGAFSWVDEDRIVVRYGKPEASFLRLFTLSTRQFIDLAGPAADTPATSLLHDRLLFTQPADSDAAELWITDFGGNNQARLGLPVDLGSTMPCWSPNDRHLAFIEAKGRVRIYTTPFPALDPARLETTTPVGDQRYHLTPGCWR